MKHVLIYGTHRSYMEQDVLRLRILPSSLMYVTVCSGLKRKKNKEEERVKNAI
jgi:hypothetical protein